MRRAVKAAAAPRVLVLDDQHGSRAALRAALSGRRDLAFAGEAPLGLAGAEAVRQARPDVAIVNVVVTADRIAECVVPLVRAHPHLQVIVVSVPDDAGLKAAASAAGAADCLVRPSGPGEVAAAVRAALRAGASVVAEPAPARLVAVATGAPPRPAPPLSRREEQVLELLARGHTRREIAERLAIGVKSIETYRSRLAHKLGARTRAELVRYALESGLLRLGA